MTLSIKNLVFWGIVLVVPWDIRAQSGADCGTEHAFELFEAEEYEAAREALKVLLSGSEDSTSSCRARIYFTLGKTNTYLSNFALAIANYQHALDLLEHGSNLKAQGRVLSGMAEAYAQLGEFERAYSLEMEALKIGEAINNENSISRSRYQLGIFAFNLRRFDDALHHYLSVRDNITAQEPNPQHGAIYGAIGATYSELGHPDEAVRYLEQSVEWGDSTGVAYALGNLGVAHTLMGNYARALNYFEQSIEKKYALKDKVGVIGTKLDLSKLWIKRRDFSKAEAIIKECIQIAEEIDAKNKLRDCYQAMAILAKESGDFGKAFDYLEKYDALKDEILNEHSLRRIEEQRAIYESEKKEAEIKRLKDLEAYYRLKRTLNTLVFAGLVLIAGIGLGTAWKLRKKNDELAASGRQLSQRNEELKNFAYVASHDLKEPLRTIYSFTNLLERRYISKLDETALEYMRYILSGVNRMKTLLEDLLEYSRVDSTSAKKIKVSSNDLLRSALSNLNSTIEKKNAKIIVEPAPFPDLQVIPSQMIQVFQNLIGNALKFTNDQQPVVRINCGKEGANAYRFSVQDNGIGIDPEFQDKIFEMFTRLHRQEEFEGTGIGLATCRKIIENYGGRIWVESEAGAGATFCFTVPSRQE